MTLTQSIQDAITRAQTHPASKDRNKTISKLEDALAWAERLERNGSDASTRVHTTAALTELAPRTCNGCRPDMGVYNSNCPVHSFGVV